MAKNPALAGIQKNISQNIGVVWWAEAGSVDLSTITGEESYDELETLGFTDAGSISTDAFTIAENVEEGETLVDEGGLPIDNTESVSTPSINYALLEMPSTNASPLVYNDSIIEVDGSGNVVSITGQNPPSNKALLLITRVKNTKHVIGLPNAAFLSRGDYQYATGELNSQEVTYSILADEHGEPIYRKYVHGFNVGSDDEGTGE